MLDASQQNSKLNNYTFSKNQMSDIIDHTHDYLSSDDIEILINNLTNPELIADSAERLIYYFSNFPYTYDKIYIEVLFEFFLNENEQPDEIIAIISDILSSLFNYDEQNLSVLEVMKKEDFYSIVWPFIDRIPSAMTLYKWMIKTFPIVFDFAMENDICNILCTIIYPENEDTPTLFEFISSFARYTDYYELFDNLVSAVFEMTFTTVNTDIFKSGMFCIGEFTKRSCDLAIFVFKNPKFYEFCEKLDQGRILTFELIINLIDKTLQNLEIYRQSEILNNGIEAFLFLFRRDDDEASEIFKQCLYIIVNAAANIIDQIQLKNYEDDLLMPAVKAFSMLIYGPEMVRFYIETKIHLFLFELARNDSVSFIIHVEAFRAICNLISSSDINEIVTLVKMDFIPLAEDQIEMMIKLPNTMINALKKIVAFSEECEEAAEWRNMIFGSETIISQLNFVSEHPDEIDEDNYALDYKQNALSLLQKITIE